MGQFDIFRKKNQQKKPYFPESYPQRFLEYYEKYESDPNISNPLYTKMEILLENWKMELPDDANLHLATLITKIELEKTRKIGEKDINEFYDVVITRLEPVNKEYYLNLRLIAENLIKEYNGSGLTNAKNFKYLDNLIHGDANEIVLDSDIVLDDDETEIYSKGIRLDKNNLVIDGRGHSIDAMNKTPIFKVFSKNIVLKNIEFKKGHSHGNGGAVYVKKNTSLELSNCSFEDNHSDNVGGAIFNWGKITITECLFTNNSAKKSGGAINSQKGILKLSDTKFLNNKSENGGAIISFNEIKMNSCEFHNNAAKHSGGAINCQKSSLNISSSIFKNNLSDYNGGAIFNFGKITLKDSSFENNIAKVSGGAINNQSNGLINSINSDYNENNALDGGAIFNLGNVKLNDAILNNNSAKLVGGTIYLNYSSALILSDSYFGDNECGDEGSCIFNKSKNVKIINSEFSHNDNTPISNKGDMKIIDCIFSENKSENVIVNDENSLLAILGGNISKNDLSQCAIYNNGKYCSIDQTEFEGNESSKTAYGDIINESYLGLNDVKFKTPEKKVLNNAKIDVKKMSNSEIQTFIENSKGAEIYTFSQENASHFNFTSLNELVHESDCNLITLNENVILDLFELDFFEGGIEIDRDNLTIDGNGNTINAHNLSRIFNITGKNVTIKNLTFMQGAYLNNFEDITSGGGAIKIVKGSDVKIINCKFIKNYSDDHAGSILNNGKLISKKNKFKDNRSKYWGGAILNNGIIISENDQFKSNQADIAGAVYNNGELKVKKIKFSKNHSHLSEPIYNADCIHSQKNMDKFVYNTNKLNNDKSYGSKPFIYLKNIIENSNYIELEHDIRFDYENDFEIEFINIDDDLIIEGNGFSIDGDNSSSFFHINANATFKNLVFKNAYSKEGSIIENNGDATFENCKFLNNKITTNNHLINNNNTLKITGSIISNNSSKNKSLINNNSSLEIYETNFINNNSQSDGGVINNSLNDVKTLIVDSNFTLNSSEKNGGTILNGEHSSMKISNSKFNLNSSTQGGAIFNFGNMDLKNNIFNFNKARGPGGAIYSQNGHLTIIHCEFSNNSAENGGAIGNFSEIYMNESGFIRNSAKLYGGAINNQSGGVVNSSKSQFISNVAKSGGAIYLINENSLNLEKCEFFENKPNDIIK